MKAIIVDDEYYAREGLKQKLIDIGGIDVIGMFDNGCSFIDAVDTLNPDLVFLDIEMPEMNGFKALEELTLRNCSPSVIFVTAFSQYALDAFDTDAVDYIVKPIEIERLLRAIARVKPKSPTILSTKVKVTCFHHFSTEVGACLIDDNWKTKKTAELFAYLLSVKGNYVSKERLAEVLWPNIEPEKSISNLYTAQYFLKNQFTSLGFNNILDIKRGKIRIQTEYIECDMFQLDEVITASDKSITLSEKALSIYKGLLFDDEYYEWAEELQRFYEAEFEKLLYDVLKNYKLKGNIDKILYYKKIYPNYFS